MHKGQQQGIALIQVLLISMVVSLLALYFVGSSRDQVTMASLLQQRAKAQLEVHSARNRMLFSLMTHQTFETSSSSDAVVNHWRFDGKPFEFGGVEYRLQDQSGLVGARFPNKEYLNPLIESQLGGVNAERMRQSLIDWQNPKVESQLNAVNQGLNGAEVRKGGMLSLNELRFIPNWGPKSAGVMTPYLTLYFANFFSISSAPDAVIRALFPDVADSLISLKNERRLTRQTFSQATGEYPDASFVFYPGPYIEVSVTASSGESIVTESWVIKSQATEKEPYLVLENR
ncbi:type II secretion system protein GspK [Ferrimonas aestuarii]|uniref:type II secretion system protein GspK n=1 Tax=Ferrimonas aestuarii TaxID=2569539 RepID=UPI00145F979A|nr:type II secretion system protein GspK [Ferrimonas aestuarii]